MSEKRVLRRSRCVSFLRLILVLVLAFMISRTYTTYAEDNTGNLQVEVIDVGEGLSVLLSSDNHYMLYDGGGRDTSSKVVSVLQNKGISSVDCLIASHYDEDHLAGLVGVIHTFDIGMVLAPNYSVSSDIYKAFANALQNKAYPIVTPARGTSFELGSALVTVLSDAISWKEENNDYSIVVRVDQGDRSILLTGDTTVAGENEMLKTGENLKCDVLVVGHHGSDSSTSDMFLTAVDPAVAVISCSTDNSYGHPTQSVMERLQQHGTAILRTDHQGDLFMETDGTVWNFIPAPSDEYSSFDWNDGAGTDDTSMTRDLLTLIDENENVDISTNDELREITGEEAADTYSYVLNTHTRKFHYPDCKSVDSIKADNYATSELSRDELIEQGYDPCGNCKP